MRSRSVAVLVCCFLAGVPCASRAQAQNDAPSFLDRATGAYGLGHYAVAAENFEKAYEARPEPPLLFNAAEAHRLAGNKQRALELYESYLRMYGKKGKRAEIAARIRDLKQAIEQDTKGASTPPVTTEPLPVPQPPLAPNPAPAPGGEQQLSVAPGIGGPTTPVPGLDPWTTTQTPPSPERTSAPALVVQTPSRDRVEHPWRGAGIGVAAAGGALIAAGVLFGLAAHQAGKDVSVRYDESKASAGALAEKIGVAADVVGVAAVVTGVLLISHRRQGRAAPMANLRAGVTGDQRSAALVVGGTF